MLYTRISPSGEPLEPSFNLTELKRRLSNVSLPEEPTNEELIPLGYECVHPIRKTTFMSLDRPDFHSVVPDIPERRPNDGEYHTGELRARFKFIPYVEGELESRRAILREDRNRLLAESDWIIQRHREQRDLGVATTLNEETFRAWMEYRQNLRDLPIDESDPSKLHIPDIPGVIIPTKVENLP